MPYRFPSQPRLQGQPPSSREPAPPKFPYLKLTEEQRLRGEQLQDALDDDESPDSIWVACEACGNTTQHAHAVWRRRVCTSCERQLTRPLDDLEPGEDDPLDQDQNGPVISSFDEELWRRAPTQGRALRDYEIISPETIDSYIQILLNPPARSG